MLAKYFKDTKEKNDFYIAIVVILLAGAMILYYSFAGNKSVLPIADSEEVVTIEGQDYLAVNVEEEFGSDHSKKRTRHIVEEVPVVVAPMARKKDTIEILPESTDLDEALEDNDPVLEEDDRMIETESINHNTSPKILDNPIDTGLLDTTFVEIEEPTKAETEPKKQVITPTKEQRDKEQNCIILLGAFSKRKNIERIYFRLKKEGYKIFQTPYRGLTRMGIYYPCDESIVEKLAELKVKYHAKDAFILKRK